MIVFAMIPAMFTALMWRWLVLRGLGVREALLAANVIFGVLVVFSTETLTVVHQLHFLTLFLFWSAAAVVVGMLLLRIPGAFGWAFPKIELGLMEKISLGMGAFIIFVVGFIALVAPPNTWDSMTYHMSRVVHWKQNNGVMNYPTSIIRQLVYLPFAEYMILHLQVLSGGDRFANMVQWEALVLSATGASLIARAVGLLRFGQILAALLVLTLPMAILQGSSTQNDLVVTSLIVSGVCFILKFILSSQRRWAVLAAASAGLAALTKGTGFLLLLPFMVTALFRAGIDIRRKALLLGVAVIALVVLAGPFMLRLTGVDRNPFAAMEKGGKVSMDKVGLAETASNGFRNLFMQMALPSKEWNRSLEGLAARVHQALGIGVSDPRTTFNGSFGLTFELDEDVAVNPLHMLLVLMAVCCFWFYCAGNRALCWYAVMSGMAVLLLCMTVKWQPWISRFHVPLFVLAMPVVAAVAERVFHRRALAGLAALVFLLALYPLFLNNTRRIFSEKNMFAYTREQGYFARDISAYPVASKIAGMFKAMGCREVGLRLGSNEWEYTWQAMLGPDVRVEHVGVEGDTAAFAYPKGEFHPCAVIDMVDPAGAGPAAFNGRPYARVAGTPTLALYLNSNYR